MNSSDPHEEFDEYRLADEERPVTCRRCGAALNAAGSCDRCEQLMQQVAEQEPSSEPMRDEFGMPLEEERPRRRGRRGWSDLLELEEQADGELPASFYAAALGVIVVVSLASVLLDAPVACSRWIGVLMLAGGAAGLVTSCRWLRKEYDDSIGVLIGLPFRAVANMMFPNSATPVPAGPAMDVGRWSVLAMGFGVASILVSVALSFMY